jgi:uroporphyrin-III C-methyltransferase
VRSPTDLNQPFANEFPQPPLPGGAGIVYLVGAGPGDPELLTLKGRRVLECADSVLYDELANRELLQFTAPHAERVYVGKRAHRHSLPQADIVRLMIERARQGWCVVRLKGGDPFLFGRGAEEGEQLSAAGIAWQVVPGVSAGTAVPASAGIPITRREVASSVAFITGHCGASDGVPLPQADTIVVFMGLAALPDLAARMLRAGREAATPVAVIENGTLPQERVVTGTILDIAEKVRAAALQSPALVVVGEVVRLRESLQPGAAPAAAAAHGFSAAPAETGFIVLAHGSPLASWHESIERLCGELRLAGSFVEPAYLPPASPALADAVDRAVAAGLTSLVVVPYFLALGLHVSRDLPALVEEQRRRYPNLDIEVADCLDGHPALRTAVLARALEAEKRLAAQSVKAGIAVNR